MAYGPEWRALQVAPPNVSGLMAATQEGFNSAGEAGREILAAYDAGQKLKNDTAVAQELAQINTPEQLQKWMQGGGLNGRNVSAASIDAMLGLTDTIRSNARADAQAAARGTAGSSGGRSSGRSSGRRSSSGRRRSGSSSSDDGMSTDALMAIALGNAAQAAPTAAPVAATEPAVAVAPEPIAPAPAAFTPGATSTSSAPDFSSLSDADLDAQIAALGG